MSARGDRGSAIKSRLDPLDALMLAGATAIVAGVAQIYLPAAYIVAGLFLCIAAYQLGLPRGSGGE